MESIINEGSTSQFSWSSTLKNEMKHPKKKKKRALGILANAYSTHPSISKTRGFECYQHCLARFLS